MGETIQNNTSLHEILIHQINQWPGGDERIKYH